jgi:hypothetical protein
MKNIKQKTANASKEALIKKRKTKLKFNLHKQDTVKGDNP